MGTQSSGPDGRRFKEHYTLIIYRKHTTTLKKQWTSVYVRIDYVTRWDFDKDRGTFLLSLDIFCIFMYFCMLIFFGSLYVWFKKILKSFTLPGLDLSFPSSVLNFLPIHTYVGYLFSLLPREVTECRSRSHFWFTKTLMLKLLGSLFRTMCPLPNIPRIFSPCTL